MSDSRVGGGGDTPAARGHVPYRMSAELRRRRLRVESSRRKALSVPAAFGAL